MSAQPHETQTMTEAEYLEFDRASDIKHEFVNGEVYSMAGASLAHNLIVGNTVTALNNQLANSPCLVSTSDMRVKISQRRSYRYPDVTIICDDPELDDSHYDILMNPTVLIEVLSPSTALIDRNEKLREYRQIVSAREYLLISQDEARIERFLRQNDNEWIYTDVSGITATIEIPSVGCVLALSDVYRKVTFNQ